MHDSLTIVVRYHYRFILPLFTIMDSNQVNNNSVSLSQDNTAMPLNIFIYFSNTVAFYMSKSVI